MLNPASTEEREARDKLTKHHMALDALNREFPEFPKLCRKIESVLKQFAAEKNVHVDKLKFGDVKWYNDGHVVCEVSASKLEIIGVNGLYKQVIQAVTGIGHQLIATYLEKSSLRLITFTGIGVSDQGQLKFRIRYANRPAEPRVVKGI